MQKKRFSPLKFLARRADTLLLILFIAALILYILSKQLDFLAPYQGKISRIYFAMVGLAAMVIGWRDRKNILGMVCLFAGIATLAVLMIPTIPSRWLILSILMITIVICILLNAFSTKKEKEKE